jgi:large subunit ribosomal protein L40e
MAFPEAVERTLIKKICMHCGATNAKKALRCRKCMKKDLRVKAKDRRGA